MIGSMIRGIQASGPAMINRTKMNRIANTMSVADTTVPDVKNSRTESKSRIWLARMPTDGGRFSIFTDMTCSKIFAASTTSIFLPVMSMMRLRTTFSRKSKAMASPSPILSAISEGMAPLGITRS
jgi:hypothetical protein